MTTAGSNFISGITTSVFSSTDVVNKDYVDNYIFEPPSQTGNDGKFLTTTDGTNISWDYVSNYEEFTSTGEQSFTVPSYANLLYIEAVGAGGGGSAGQTLAQEGIAWTLRTSGFATNTILALTYGNNLYVAAGSGGRLNTSTDAIRWTLRTSGFGSNFIYALTYGNNTYVAAGVSGRLNTSTDAIVWTLRTSGFDFNDIFALTYGNNIYISAGNLGRLSTSYAQISGAGGGAGSYTSWYIPKSIVTSNITVNLGVGGAGATTDAATGSAGAGTIISWTGPGGTYTIIASGGSGTAPGEAQLTSQSSSFYTTVGGSGAPLTPIGAGFTATTQTNQFQPTGGGSGAASTESSGGSGGAINVYGISTSASGGDSTGTNGTNAIVISGLPYGYGGGGGGASVSIAATGGNGVRGGGGGGGASIGSTFGNGGNGGDGYVKITWW